MMIHDHVTCSSNRFSILLQTGWPLTWKTGKSGKMFLMEKLDKFKLESGKSQGKLKVRNNSHPDKLLSLTLRLNDIDISNINII